MSGVGSERVGASSAGGARDEAALAPWYTIGIGVVKEAGTVEGDFSSSELVSTNVPEPTVAVLLSLSLTALAMTRRRKTW